MGLNKLDNFIKNTEGRILYVNPNDLDSTDSIENQGNSLARPFKTIQRALLEAARFSYIKGNNNDLVEKTTILLFPGQHLIDNRPGWVIYNNSGSAKVISRSGAESLASSVLSLDLNSNFDLTQEDNILYKFNSVYGGIVVPRGTSIVGLDLRKTKIRPKYVPNPTDDNVDKSAIFRITGACYFWQFSIFDGDSSDLVYTNPDNFGAVNQSTPTFSHHKLTCFEFCDGVNEVGSYGLTDLDMYYSKVSNAYNAYREIDQKFPEQSDGFAKRNPEWEIVGAFASDPIEIDSIISGNGLTASSIVTVTTVVDHNLNAGTPIKIKGVGDGTGATENYNISTTVQNVLSPTSFTYLLPALESYVTIDPTPASSGATVTVETDTVSGASPYIFNCSLRSVWGMNGLHADGKKASGFRSTVVAQFTAVSLQKDDRAFAKYDQSSRTYQVVDYTPVYGSELPRGASQTDSSKVYHLDPEAIYRKGWESSHIKISNDAFIQIVSVFAIGFNKHFDAETGGDASITNSNSNFGQISLSSSGFKKEAFNKDNKGFITSVIPPREVNQTEQQVDWIPIDVNLTLSRANSGHLYLYGFNSIDNPPTSIIQGYRIGARLNDLLYLTNAGTTYSASIYMCDNEISKTSYTSASGSTSSVKTYRVTSGPTSNSFTIGTNNLITGEKVKITSDDGDLPENIEAHQTYYVIRDGSTKIKLASSYTNAVQSIPQEITVYGGTNLTILSRVSDKDAGELGSPIQFDAGNNNWFIHVSNEIYNAIFSGGTSVFGDITDTSFVKRISDERSLDEKLYKFRVVIPKEIENAKDPEPGFILQESSTTGFESSSEFTRVSIGNSDYQYNKNPRFITTCTESSGTVTVITELPHNIQVGEVVNIKNVTSTTNTTGLFNEGYNGTFVVTGISNANTFQYSTTDVNEITHSTGTFTNDTSVRDEYLPRFERNDWGSNLFIYRRDIIKPYIQNKQDGIYHLYVLNANNQVTTEFTNLKFGQLSADLYPQLDRDNIEANPRAAKTFAKRSPIGEVVTNDLKKSITRETADLLLKEVGVGITISSVSSSTSSATITFPKFHGLSGIVTGTVTSGASYNSGTYYGVKLLNTSSSGTWKGATAKVVVIGGAVISADIMSPGSGYGAEALFFEAARIGSGNNVARYNTTLSGISTNIGDVVQITGIGTVSDGYYRITSVPSSTTISIAKTAGDPAILSNQYAFVVGPSIKISSSSSYSSVTGITTFTTSSAHGLLSGNKFRVIDSSNNNLGDYSVKDRISTTSFTAITNTSISAANGYILKHGLSSNEGSSGIGGENLGTRGVSFYNNETFILTSSLTTGTTISITASGIGTAQRLPLGSYIQIDHEIMRVVTSNNTTSATVVRGVFGSVQENHDSGSLIRKINPKAVEFRRPSIIRASGHTFEYLGYGPGNYSTGLPQVQIKTLSESEQFFAQAQERSCGVVVYTGMNNNGDVFNGNTKTIASSGEVVSYDIPRPSVTGEDANKSIATFDEITIKERILVEGGTSGQVLSQFDGPVTFNKDIRLNGNLLINGTTKFTDTLNVTESISISGELTVNTGITPDTDLGAYLGKSNRAFTEAYIGKIKIAQTDDNTIDTSTGSLKLSATTGSNVAIQTSTTINGTASITGNTTITGNLDLTGSPSSSGRISANYLDVPNITPIGSIIMWPGTISNFPTGWAICNGQSLSASTYSSLFSIIGYTYGGSGGTFNLPNMVDRFVVGTGNLYSVGNSGGSKDASLVSHTHTATSDTQGTHTHRILASDNDDSTTNRLVAGNNKYVAGDDPGAGGAYITKNTSGTGLQILENSGSHNHTITVASSGVSASDANLPPYFALIYLMRIQ